MAIEPLATLCHSAVRDAVGLAAKRRKADGSTPSTAASAPFTFTRAASTASAARTPCSPRTFATARAGSGSWDTTSTSADSSLRGGRATDGAAGPDAVPPPGPKVPGGAGCAGTDIGVVVVIIRAWDAPPAGGEPAATTSSAAAAPRTGTSGRHDSLPG